MNVESCSGRIGCVQYLNARPLIHGFCGEVIYDHPAHLTALLQQGGLDVALVPVFTLFNGTVWNVVDGVSISSDGPVYSVFLAFKGRLQDVKRVTLDPASLSSNNLLRCLLVECYGLRPQFVKEDSESRLLIGNQAISFRQEQGDGWNYLDLGELWKQFTGLPFVFALWLMPAGLSSAPLIAKTLREVKNNGVRNLEEIVREESRYEAGFVRNYLSGCIRYDFGPREKMAVARYQQLLSTHGVIGGSVKAWTCV